MEKPSPSLRPVSVFLCLLLLALGPAVSAQQPSASRNPEAAATLSGSDASELRGTPSASVVPSLPVPRLIKFNGSATDSAGQPRGGVVGITFAVYAAQDGGAPLWMETQNVSLDSQGNYSVLLGSTQSQGVPIELFGAGDPRWLGVTVSLPGEVEQPRVLLVSVPYALKASDADTLGGQPISSFVLRDAASNVNSGSGTVTLVNSGTGLTGGPITTSGTLSLDLGFTDSRYLQPNGNGSRLTHVNAATLNGLTSAAFVQANAPNIPFAGSASFGGGITVGGGIMAGGSITAGGSVTAPLFSGSFMGSGVGLTGVNAATLGGFAPNAFVQLGTAAHPLTQNLNGTLNLNGKLTLTPLNGVNPTFTVKDADGSSFSVATTATFQNNDGSGGYIKSDPPTPSEPGGALAVHGIQGSDYGSNIDLLPGGGAKANGVVNVFGDLQIANGGFISFSDGSTISSGKGTTGGGGGGTITGVTAGTGLTGGGTSGNVVLGINPAVVPTINGGNTYNGNQDIQGNLTLTNSSGQPTFMVNGASGSIAMSNGTSTVTQNAAGGTAQSNACTNTSCTADANNMVCASGTTCNNSTAASNSATCPTGDTCSGLTGTQSHAVCTSGATCGPMTGSESDCNSSGCTGAANNMVCAPGATCNNSAAASDSATCAAGDTCSNLTGSQSHAVCATGATCGPMTGSESDCNSSGCTGAANNMVCAPGATCNNSAAASDSATCTAGDTCSNLTGSQSHAVCATGATCSNMTGSESDCNSSSCEAASNQATCPTGATCSGMIATNSTCNSGGCTAATTMCTDAASTTCTPLVVGNAGTGNVIQAERGSTILLALNTTGDATISHSITAPTINTSELCVGGVCTTTGGSSAPSLSGGNGLKFSPSPCPGSSSSCIAELDPSLFSASTSGLSITPPVTVATLNAGSVTATGSIAGNSGSFTSLGAGSISLTTPTGGISSSGALNLAATTDTTLSGNNISLENSGTGGIILGSGNGTVTIRNDALYSNHCTATAASGCASAAIGSQASTFNSTTSSAVPQTFQFVALPINNDTPNASAQISLNYAYGSNTPVPTGFSLSPTGDIQANSVNASTVNTSSVCFTSGGCMDAPPGGGSGSNLTATTPLAISSNNISLNVVPVALGGTGSSTQNFVDLSSSQSIGGGKTFLSGITAPNASFSSLATNGITIGSASGIVQNAGGVTLFSPTLALSAGTSPGTGPLTLNASNLTANTTGGVFLNDASREGDVFQWTGGSFIADPTTGAALSSPSVSLTATNGNITLENNDTTSGNILIGANAATVASYNPSSCSQVTIIIGNVPCNPAPGSVPGNVYIMGGSSSTPGIVSVLSPFFVSPSGITFSDGTKMTTAPTGGSSFSLSATDGLSASPSSCTSSCTLSIASGGVTNADLANSSVTINSGTGISGGGTVSLGGSVTLANTGVLSLTGSNNISVGSGQNPTVSIAGAIPIANGGTGLSTGPTSAGQFLRSSSSGTWSTGTIQPGDLPSNLVTNVAGIFPVMENTVSGTSTISLGVVPIANGGTGINTVPTGGQFLRGDGTGNWTAGTLQPSDVPSLSSSYVDLSGTQTVGGSKTFTSGINATNADISQLVVGSNGLSASGAATMQPTGTATSPATDAPSFPVILASSVSFGSAPQTAAYALQNTLGGNMTAPTTFGVSFTPDLPSTPFQPTGFKVSQFGGVTTTGVSDATTGHTISVPANCTTGQVPTSNGFGWNCTTLPSGGISSVAATAPLTSNTVSGTATVGIQGCSAGQTYVWNGTAWVCTSPATLLVGIGLTGGGALTPGGFITEGLNSSIVPNLLNSLNTFNGTVAASGLSASTVSATTAMTAAAYDTASDCSSVASPAICGSAAAGSFTVPVGATSTVVDTSAVTAKSEVMITFDASLGAKLGVTCNTTFNPAWVAARTTGTSVTINVSSAPTASADCFSYHVIN